MACLWEAFEKCVLTGNPEKQRIKSQKGNDPIPINEAGIISYISLGWLTPLILKLFKDRDKEIREEDVWTCSELEGCSINTERLEPMWMDELQTYGRQKCSILRLWLKFIWVRLLIVFITLCFNAVLTFLVKGYFTDVVTEYLEGPETSISFAVGLVMVCLVGQFLKCYSLSLLLFLEHKRVITIFGSDTLRVFLNTQLFVYLIAMPIYLIIGTVYIYYLIGLWCFVAFATFLGFYLLQACLIELVSFLRRKTLVWTDIRIRKMNEVLTSMKLIKMYAWEGSFKNSIMGIRTAETKPLVQSTIVNMIVNAIIPVTPSLATVATIATYANAGNELTASTAFSIVATLSFMRVIVSFVPFAARIFGETRISFERIKRFMLEEEFKPPGRNVLNSGNVIELRNTVFMWSGDNNNNPGNKQRTKDKKGAKYDSSTSLALRSINLTVSRGKHIGICGAVGCGKSSLLQALIGRMPLITGDIAVDGTVAYAAQQAWIFNGTLRDNVLFGRPFHQEWYTKVLHACSLDPDIRILANGDMTEIGDRGINLSGGQKQRVSLARAVYSKSDIYLLDDPLSAVDVHVGQHLFHKCIDKVLKDKTVVLVTHQLQYLKHCDEIYVMDDGELVEHGTHDSLLAIEGYYTKVMEQFNSNMDFAAVDDNADNDVDEEDSVDISSKKQRNASIVPADNNHNYEKGILTYRETSQTGDISKDAYMSYVRAAGGKIVAVLVFLLYVCTLSSVAFSEWWLGIWIERTTIPVQVTLPSQSNTAGENITFSENYTTSTLTNTTSSWNTEEEMEEEDWYLTVYMFTTVVISGLAILKGFIAGMVMIKASVNLHNKAIEKVMGAPMQYFDANPPGRVLNRFSRDVEDADIFLPNLMDNLLQVMVVITAALVTTAYNLPWFLIAVVPIGFYFYVIKIIASVPIRNFKRLENVLRSPLLSHVNISCSGLSTIVSYSQENNFTNECKKYSDATSMGMLLFEASMRWMSLRMDLGGGLVAVITTIAVLFTKGTISPALAALSLTMSLKASSVIQFFAQMLNEVEARFTAIERMHEYESLSIEKEARGLHVVKNWPSQGRITFSDVTMKYRSDMDPVLRNINLEILPRQKVGIVGRTGAGKSSLVAALFRLTDISEGQMIIDDVDIGTISRKHLRTCLSSIPQDPVLFAGTLRYNLDPFDKYTDAKIWAALEQVHMKERMKLLDQSLSLHIEENGENFSVGERQLICLARAILRQNKVLILDEATASIDTKTDSLIQQTIRDSFSDCTVLTIAHRLNTVLHCDVILVMEAGQVIETGNPQTLLLSPYSHFSNMIRAQTILSPE